MNITHHFKIAFSDGFQIHDKATTQDEVNFPLQTELEFVAKSIKRVCLENDRNPADVIALQINSEIK